MAVKRGICQEEDISGSNTAYKYFLFKNVNMKSLLFPSSTTPA